jgi:outer membrane protein assembly factor BamE (lipoprotein component of BamABCDE complex)
MSGCGHDPNASGMNPGKEADINLEKETGVHAGNAAAGDAKAGDANKVDGAMTDTDANAGNEADANAGNQKVSNADGLTGEHSAVEEAEKAVDLAFVKQNLKQRMSKEEVKRLFGTVYTEVYGMDDDETWRYDFGKKEGYEFHVEGNLDAVDLEGLRQGSLASQLFVSFDEKGEVKSFAYYYLGADGMIHEYRVMPDGSVKEEEI